MAVIQKLFAVRLLLIGGILLGLTGCGATTTMTPDPGINQNNIANSKPWSSLEEFFAKQGSAKLDELKESMNDTIEDTLGVGGEIDVRVQGNELSYIFKFGTGVNTVGLKESLDLAMDSMETVFVGVANTLKASTHLDKVLVTVKYVDAQNKVLTSRTFQSNNAIVAPGGNNAGTPTSAVASAMEAGLPSGQQESAPSEASGDDAEPSATP